MLTYNFSKREKIMLAVLAVVAVGILWYQLVYNNVQRQVEALDAEITLAQDQVALDTTRIAELKSMEEAIATYKAEGREVVVMPAYDNTDALMNELDATLGGMGFSFSTDALDTTTTAGIVMRGMTLEFTAGSYESARAALDTLVKDGFPCSIESVNVVDKSAGSGSGTEGGVTVRAHLTFFETDASGYFAAIAEAEEAAENGTSASASVTDSIVQGATNTVNNVQQATASPSMEVEGQ